MHKNTYGFTIVELLIVIVVIAILAAISILAYNGIQNRANDTVIQGDLENITKKVQLYSGEYGLYPTNTELINSGIKVSKDAYLITNNAMLYCRASDGSTFAIIAKSKSGKTYYASNSTGSVQLASFSFPTGMAIDCPSAGTTNGTGTQWFHTLGSGWVSGL